MTSQRNEDYAGVMFDENSPGLFEQKAQQINGSFGPCEAGFYSQSDGADDALLSKGYDSKSSPRNRDGFDLEFGAAKLDKDQFSLERCFEASNVNNNSSISSAEKNGDNYPRHSLPEASFAQPQVRSLNDDSVSRSSERRISGDRSLRTGARDSIKFNSAQDKTSDEIARMSPQTASNKSRHGENMIASPGLDADVPADFVGNPRGPVNQFATAVNGDISMDRIQNDQNSKVLEDTDVHKNNNTRDKQKLRLKQQKSANQLENGGKNGLKIANEHIFPWMKESRQNQKKKHTNSVSSEDSDKGFGGSKRERTAYTNSQLVELEKEFHFSHYLCRPRRIELAQGLGLSERQIKIWFQNRRMKFKKEQKQKLVVHRNNDPQLTGGLPVRGGHQHHYPYRGQNPHSMTFQDEQIHKCRAHNYNGVNHHEEVNFNQTDNQPNCDTHGNMMSPVHRHPAFVSQPSIRATHGHHHAATQSHTRSPSSGASNTSSPHLMTSHVDNASKNFYKQVNHAAEQQNGYSGFMKTPSGCSDARYLTASGGKEALYGNHHKNTFARQNPNQLRYPTHLSSLNDYVHGNRHNQDFGDVTINPFTHRTQRNIPPQFLPIAYYGSSPDVEYFSNSMGDKNIPIDYSISGYPGSDSNPRPLGEKPSHFQRLTHL